VYIGILLDISNIKAIVLGAAASVIILVIRQTGRIIGPMKKEFNKGELFLINSLFARGIAPVAIVLMAVEKGIIINKLLIDSLYFTITATIILSSVMIFFYKKFYSNKDNK